MISQTDGCCGSFCIDIDCLLIYSLLSHQKVRIVMMLNYVAAGGTEKHLDNLWSDCGHWSEADFSVYHTNKHTRVQCHYNMINFHKKSPQQTPHWLPIRAGYNMLFMLCFNFCSAVYNITLFGPPYNGICLQFVFLYFFWYYQYTVILFHN